MEFGEVFEIDNRNPARSRVRALLGLGLEHTHRSSGLNLAYSMKKPVDPTNVIAIEET